MTEHVGSDQLVLADVFESIGRHRRPIAIITAAAGVIAAIVLLIVPAKYTGRISLIPESRPNLASGGLAGLVELAGMSLPGATGAVGHSPQFYAALLQSRPIMYAVLARRYPTTGLRGRIVQEDSATLVRIVKPAGVTDSQRLWNAARELGGMINVGTDIRTGIITLSVKHRSPVLAASVAAAFTEELERFNRQARQTQAGKRRRFVEGRLLEAEGALRDAENELRDFLLRNREYQVSPTLRFEHSRLDRALTVQQELYLNLRRELDAARIAEVDDVPAITITEPAIVPQRRSSPLRRVWMAVTLAAAFLASVSWAVVVDHHARLAPGLGSALRALWSRARPR